jgi:hypothetical protein
MQRLLIAADAAAYLGIGLRTFDAIARPHLPYILIGKRARRYDRADLDRWVERQAKIDPAGAVQPRGPTCTTRNPKGSTSEDPSGGSKKPSALASNATSFESRLDAARSRRQRGS